MKWKNVTLKFADIMDSLKKYFVKRDGRKDSQDLCRQSQQDLEGKGILDEGNGMKMWSQ